MSDANLAQILWEAEKALQDGAWEEARRLYRQALDLEPHHAQAQRGLARLESLEETDREVRERIEEGDERFRMGAYKEAFDAYTQALNQAGHAGILKYHAELERKRNRARDLAAWQERVREALQEARRHHRRRDFEAALEPLDRLLRELPEEDPYQAMAADLHQLREEIMKDLSAEELLEQARRAYRAQDFERAMQLAQAVPPTSPRHADAQRLLGEARDFFRRFIQPALERAESALQEGRWADAFAELDNLREQYPDSPSWHRLWLKVGMTHGQEALNEGRQANAQREFEAARRHFEQARRAFGKVLEVYPSHATAPALRDEAADLVQIAVEENQARTDWEAGRREEALKTLERALSRIEHARGEGRDYAAVAAVVRAMHEALQGEIERIREEERRLQDGERLLGERRLDEAADRFRETLDALLSDHQRWAADGLNRAEAEIHLFEEEMERGRTAADPFTAVEAFQAAYDRWPGGPKAAEALEETLVEVGERAREAG